MPYTDQKKFHADYYKTDMKYVIANNIHHMSAEQAFEFYRNTFAKKTAKRADGFLLVNFHVFGRHVYKRDASIAFGDYVPDDPEKGAGIGSEEFANLGALLEAGWTIAINDTWLLGGVNSLAEFHAASPLTWKNILDDEHIMTITGRELVGLALAGYIQTSGHEALNKVYMPGADKAKAENLTFGAYDEEVSKLKNQAELMHFLASNTKWKFD
jgi:hypothetical protein